MRSPGYRLCIYAPTLSNGVVAIPDLREVVHVLLSCPLFDLWEATVDAGEVITNDGWLVCRRRGRALEATELDEHVAVAIQDAVAADNLESISCEARVRVNNDTLPSPWYYYLHFGLPVDVETREYWPGWSIVSLEMRSPQLATLPDQWQNSLAHLMVSLVPALGGLFADVLPLDVDRRTDPYDRHVRGDATLTKAPAASWFALLPPDTVDAIGGAAALNSDLPVVRVMPVEYRNGRTGMLVQATPSYGDYLGAPADAWSRFLLDISSGSDDPPVR